MAATALVVACGGGGGDTSAPQVPAGPEPLKLSGVAATGAAMAGASVQVRCVGANGATTTAADGSYAVQISGASLPCVLNAIAADGSVQLRSVANPANGVTQVVQINPVTELVVAQLAGSDTAAFFAAFDSASAQRVTSGAVATAVSQVVVVLRDGGVDLGAVGDPFTAPLVAAHGTVTGNSYDRVLDALGAQLKQAGTSLQQLATQLAQTATTPAAGAAPADPAVAPAMLLRAAHPDCAALRSGTYRFIAPSSTTSPTRLIQIDAPTATITWPDGSTATARSLGACTFQDTTEATRWVVSAAGVLVGLDNGLALAFPEQPTTAADWAGRWNWAAWTQLEGAASGQRDLELGTLDVDPQGRITGLSDCPGLQPCVPASGALPTLRSRSGGGLEVVDGASGRATALFLYRPAVGGAMGVLVSATDLVLLAPANTLTLPALNDGWHRLDVSLDPLMRPSSGFSFSSYRAASVDQANSSYTRRRLQDGGQQVFRFNQPRAGMVYRGAGSGVFDSGTTFNYSELFVLPLGGTGIVAYGRPATADQRSAGVFGLAISVSALADVASGPLATPTTGSTPTTGPTVTALDFFPGTAPRLVVDFSTPMATGYSTTGSYVPASTVWESSTRLVITFTSYAPGGTITLKAPTASNVQGFRSATGVAMAQDVTFQFP